ncbi:MAG: hypothetical protein AAGI91_08485 [Bacteroidota bacterium]
MRCTLALAFLLTFALPAAHAQIGVLGYAGYDTDAEGLVVGVGAEVDLPVAAPVALAVRPSGEYLLATDITVADRVFTRTMGQVNLDLIARLGTPGIQPYAGAGLSVRLISFDTSDDDAVEGDLDSAENNVGANLLAGVAFGGLGPVSLFVQGRATLSSGSAGTFVGGLRVGL